MSIVQNQVVQVTTDPLAELATEINTAHDAACRAAASALEHARKCGELLIQAKADIGHGGWLPWLESNCRVGERQARRYMEIFRAVESGELKSDLMSEMTMTGVLDILRDAKKLADQETKEPKPEPSLAESIDHLCRTTRKIAEKWPQEHPNLLPLVLASEAERYDEAGVLAKRDKGEKRVAAIDAVIAKHTKGRPWKDAPCANCPKRDEGHQWGDEDCELCHEPAPVNDDERVLVYLANEAVHLGDRAKKLLEILHSDDKQDRLGHSFREAAHQRFIREFEYSVEAVRSSVSPFHGHYDASSEDEEKLLALCAVLDGRASA